MDKIPNFEPHKLSFWPNQPYGIDRSVEKYFSFVAYRVTDDIGVFGNENESDEE